MPKALDLAGRTFGRLRVIERAHVDGARNVMWRCVCECGGEKIAAAANIGRTTLSCGCLADEVHSRILREKKYSRTHGMSKTSEYQIWTRMIQRCHNPDNPGYYKYGARGISVCAQWRESFETFILDMGARPSPKHSIERFNNDGNYEPTNCGWETAKVQARNRRSSRKVSINGITKCICDWEADLNVWRGYFYDRCRETYSNHTQNLNRAHSVEDAVLEAYRQKIDPSAVLTSIC